MSGARRTAARSAAAALICIALGACSIGPQATEQPATYDLGAPRADADANPGIAAILVVPEIAAPAWLTGSGIIYRLTFENPPRPQSYGLSRWAAPPPAMLTERLRSRLARAAKGLVARVDGVRADYVLRVELEDFSQSFDAPKSSSVSLRARASLVSLADRALVAQQSFAFERPAPSPDAPGAAQALSAASDEFVESLLKWTHERIAGASRR